MCAPLSPLLVINVLVFYSVRGNKLRTEIHTFTNVISDISEGYLKDLHTSQQSFSFSVPNLPEYVQNIITAQANQQSQSSQFGFQQQQQVLQLQQQLDTTSVQQQNQFQQQCFVLECDQTITGRNLEYSRQNYFSCEISSLKLEGTKKYFSFF